MLNTINEAVYLFNLEFKIHAEFSVILNFP